MIFRAKPDPPPENAAERSEDLLVTGIDVRTVTKLSEELEQALETRELIGEAKGIIMEAGEMFCGGGLRNAQEDLAECQHDAKRRGGRGRQQSG